MLRLAKLRFSLRGIMMLVVTAAVASALFVKVWRYSSAIPTPGWKTDVPSLFLLAIFLTAVTLAAWKGHTAVQMMLQMSLACAGCLLLIWIVEAKYERAVRYWVQATFCSTVTIPLLVRQLVKSRMQAGPRREWWKKTCEAICFSFLNILLVTAGGLLESAVYLLGTEVLQNLSP
jgi:hypothetical protein